MHPFLANYLPSIGMRVWAVPRYWRVELFYEDLKLYYRTTVHISLS